jgi:hypothetical protein
MTRWLIALTLLLLPLLAGCAASSAETLEPRLDPMVCADTPTGVMLACAPVV